jgi:hypothetical protein
MKLKKIYVVQSEEQPSGMMRIGFGNEWWPDEGGRRRWQRRWQRSALRERARRDRAEKKGLRGLNFSSVTPTDLTRLVNIRHKWLDHESNGVTQSHHSRWLEDKQVPSLCSMRCDTTHIIFRPVRLCLREPMHDTRWIDAFLRLLNLYNSNSNHVTDRDKEK